MFSKTKTFLVEVKSTAEEKFKMRGLHGIIEKANKFNVGSLLAVYFKSSHSSQGSGKWVLKLLNSELKEVTKNDRSNEI